jgi:hypothetical protein
MTEAGVQASLHVWEGLGHGTYLDDPEQPEFQEVWGVIVRFFAKNLGIH